MTGSVDESRGPKEIGHPLGLWLRRHLTRVSTGPVIREIDGLRFICITAVFLFHLNLYLSMRVYREPYARLGLISRVLEHGAWGVELFFVISGFVVSLPFARHGLLRAPRPEVKNYFVRRLTRLEPPYLINLCLAAVLLILTKHRAAVSEILPHLTASMAYAHALVFRAPSTINEVAWSLEVEIQFYVLAPLFTRVFFIERRGLRRSILVTAGAAAAALPVALKVFLDPRVIGLSLARYLTFFIMGMLLVDLYLVDWKSQPSRSAGWDILGLAAAISAVAVTLSKIDPWLAMPPLFFMIGCATFRGRLTNAVLSTPLLTAIGGMCYTIYLYHGFVISFAGRFLSPLTRLPFTLGLLVATALTASLTLLVCVSLFITIERPCMNPKWPARLAARFAAGFGRRP